MKKHTTYISLFFLVFLSFLISSCTYKNAIIPDIQKPIVIDTTLNIDTTLSATDTSGFIYGRIFQNGATTGIPFGTYTVDTYLGTDSILSLSTVFNNQQILIALNSRELGTYNAVSFINMPPKSCLVFFDPDFNNKNNQLVNFTEGEIVVTSFDSALNIYRGTIDVKDTDNKYQIKADFAFKIRIISFPL